MQQTSTPAAPQAPAAPAPPGAPAPSPATIQIPVPSPTSDVAPGPGNPFMVTVQTAEVPQTQAQVDALRERGTQLSNQLQSVTRRRNEAAQQLRRADGADRAGLEQRIMLHDQRIMAIETEIAANGRLLAAAPPALVTNTETRSSPADFAPSPAQTTAIAIVFNVVVLAPIAFAFARRILRRPFKPTPAAAESGQRLERMEQAVDAIAIEVERVSESQRFLTRLLTEASPQALPVPERAADPLRAGSR